MRGKFGGSEIDSAGIEVIRQETQKRQESSQRKAREVARDLRQWWQWAQSEFSPGDKIEVSKINTNVPSKNNGHSLVLTISSLDNFNKLIVFKGGLRMGPKQLSERYVCLVESAPADYVPPRRLKF